MDLHNIKLGIIIKLQKIELNNNKLQVKLNKLEKTLKEKINNFFKFAYNRVWKSKIIWFSNEYVIKYYHKS